MGNWSDGRAGAGMPSCRPHHSELFTEFDRQYKNPQAEGRNPKEIRISNTEVAMLEGNAGSVPVCIELLESFMKKESLRISSVTDCDRSIHSPTHMKNDPNRFFEKIPKADCIQERIQEIGKHAIMTVFGIGVVGCVMTRCLHKSNML